MTIRCSLGVMIRANRKVGSSKQKVLAKHAGKHLIAEAMNVSQEPITFYHRKTHTAYYQIMKGIDYEKIVVIIFNYFSS